jgi:hypothetical protein
MVKWSEVEICAPSHSKEVETIACQFYAQEENENLIRNLKIESQKWRKTKTSLKTSFSFSVFSNVSKNIKH